MKSSDVKAYKLFLRNKLRFSLKRIRRSNRIKKSAKIIQKLIRLRLFRNARNVLAYAALPGEVQTRKLIEQALRMRKQVYLPRIHRQMKGIDFYQVTDWKRDLRKGLYGILEPRGLKSRRVKISSLDLIIVPGLGFDLKGRRLGRGGGFYDRFLAKAVGIKKIGLAFREQRVKKIPTAVNDIHMDKVITD